MSCKVVLAAIPTTLLMRLCRATPEQLVEVEHLLEKAPGEGATQNPELLKTPGRKYLLRKELGGWRLVFDGRGTVLPDEKGVGYVAVLLLDPPQEPMHGAELANRAFGDAVVDGQRNLAIDDQETMRSMGEARRRCQAVINDPDSTELERREAEAEFEEISAWARKPLRGTEGNEQRQVRAIRQAIRRLIEKLVGEGDEVLRAFGEHLERYLWRPSGRGGRGRNSQVRTGLAGGLLTSRRRG